ncbi:MAG: class I SAM-dependent rRNA methyltransferase [Crenarchaeota archaeon]|nr:class I SAM-dependent rRNA methyltransferase [Thermoproteota archaeon]
MPPVKVKVNGVGLEKVRRGTGIVYRKWLKPPYPLPPAALVELVTPRDEPVACGLWEPEGPVAVRILGHGECRWSDSIEAVEEKLERAFRARKRIGLVDTGSYRLVNSDGDLLSGLIIDVYGGEIAVVQSSSYSFDALMEDIARLLVKLTGVDTVYEKSTQRSRRDIGLQPRSGWIIGNKKRVVIKEEGVKFIVDVLRGQKTGFYLDQRLNRLEFAKYAVEGDRVLDVFSYTGGFGIHAAYNGAREVVFLEEDRYAVEILRENLKLNNIRNYRIINSSIWEAEGLPRKHYTLVAVDPPAFIQRGDEESVRRGMRAYMRSYKWSIEKASDDAIIYLSSCSYFLTRELFLKVITTVLAERGDYKILGSLRGAAPDHVYRGEEYLDYLKGAFIHLS